MTKHRGRSSAPRFPGHLRARNGHHDHAFWLLLREYAAYDPFVSSWHDLRQRLESGKANRRDVSAWARGWNLDRLPALGMGDCAALRRDLIPGQHALRSTPPAPFELITLRTWTPRQPKAQHETRSWQWHLGNGESLGQLRARIANELGASKPGRLPAALQGQLRALPDAATAQGWVLGDSHSAVSVHVHWLFLHLCPQPERPLNYREIADWIGSDVDEHSLWRAIRTLTCILEIAPPPAQAGLSPIQQV